jgi:hypothetical protein
MWREPFFWSLTGGKLSTIKLNTNTTCKQPHQSLYTGAQMKDQMPPIQPWALIHSCHPPLPASQGHSIGTDGPANIQYIMPLATTLPPEASRRFHRGNVRCKLLCCCRFQVSHHPIRIASEQRNKTVGRRRRAGKFSQLSYRGLLPSGRGGDDLVLHASGRDGIDINVQGKKTPFTVCS